MKIVNPFLKEIIDAHIEIERWFTGAADVEQINTLLARFSPEFEMIALDGTLLNCTAVKSIFSERHGGRPGLRIAIDEAREVNLSESFGFVGYRETHIDANGVTTARRSTALLERTESGKIVWRQLQETSSALPR